MKKTVLAAVLLVLAACAPKTTVTSPDGRIAVRFELAGAGIPSYSVDVDGQPFLESSALGLVSDATQVAPLSALVVDYLL